jgi:hypothetical protein
MTRPFNCSLRRFRVCEAALIALVALGGCAAFTRPIPVVRQTLSPKHVIASNHDSESLPTRLCSVIHESCQYYRL